MGPYRNLVFTNCWQLTAFIYPVPVPPIDAAKPFFVHFRFPLSEYQSTSASKFN
jgi:hypothetical protein